MQSGLDDIGNTYVEIDYTSQHLWYYKDGSLVTDTGIVSGNISRGNGCRRRRQYSCVARNSKFD